MADEKEEEEEETVLSLLLLALLVVLATKDRLVNDPREEKPDADGSGEECSGEEAVMARRKEILNLML